ncbi:WD repeat protein [Pseudohyphozyma bogoriensis]|nr:WD repeat protein [Pseudohyphozyma bogoriensis]
MLTITSLVVIPELDVVLTGSSDRDIRVWDLKPLASLPLPSATSSKPEPDSSASTEPVSTDAPAPAPARVGAAPLPAQALAPLPLLCSLKAHTRPVEQLASYRIPNENGSVGSYGIVSVDSLGALKTWEVWRGEDGVVRGELRTERRDHEIGIYSLLVNEYEGEIWTASADNSLLLSTFSPSTPKVSPTPTLRIPHPSHVKAFLSLPFSLPTLNSSHILTGASDEIIRVFDLSLLDTEGAPATKGAPWNGVAVPADKAHDLPGLVREVEGHSHDVLDLGVYVKEADEGKKEAWIVSASIDGSLRRWKWSEVLAGEAFFDSLLHEMATSSKNKNKSASPPMHTKTPKKKHRHRAHAHSHHSKGDASSPRVNKFKDNASPEPSQTTHPSRDKALPEFNEARDEQYEMYKSEPEEGEIQSDGDMSGRETIRLKKAVVETIALDASEVESEPESFSVSRDSTTPFVRVGFFKLPVKDEDKEFTPPSPDFRSDMEGDEDGGSIAGAELDGEEESDDLEDEIEGLKEDQKAMGVEIDEGYYFLQVAPFVSHSSAVGLVSAFGAPLVKEVKIFVVRPIWLTRLSTCADLRLRPPPRSTLVAQPMPYVLRMEGGGDKSLFERLYRNGKETSKPKLWIKKTVKVENRLSLPLGDTYYFFKSGPRYFHPMTHDGFVKPLTEVDGTPSMFENYKVWVPDSYAIDLPDGADESEYVRLYEHGKLTDKWCTAANSEDCYVAMGFDKEPGADGAGAQSSWQ